MQFGAHAGVRNNFVCERKKNVLTRFQNPLTVPLVETERAITQTGAEDVELNRF